MPAKNQVEDANPVKKQTTTPNSVHLYTFVSFSSKTLKTTSGEPPVGSRSLPDTYFRSNKLLFCNRNYERPCSIQGVISPSQESR